MVKFSYIVPVYNVEKYLRKCVDSLIHQDFREYEIILVDDGSTDNSGAICDEYAAGIHNTSIHNTCPIRVIHQKNGGLSAARNAGLKVAKGEYICFLDSDDYWEPNRLGELMEQIVREQLDVLRFDYQNVRIKNEGVYEVYEPNKKPRYVDHCSDVVDGETYLATRMEYACYAAMFIMRRELVPTFVEGILFEDTEWTPRMLVRAKRVNATPTIVYNYLTRSGSITKKYDIEHIRKKNNSLMQVNISLQRLLPTVKDGRWINGCIADNVLSILNNAAAYDYESVPSLVKIIKEQNLLPLRGYKVRKTTLLRYRLINISPRIYCWLRHVRMNGLRK